MKAEEMNNMDPAKIPHSALTLALTNAVERLASETAEVNASLKCLANPPIAFDVDCNKANLSGSDFLPGGITFMESRATLRDQFAMAALQATTGWMHDSLGTTPETARRCYVMADSMLEARSNKEGKCKSAK